MHSQTSNPISDPTIAAKLEAEYLSSRPYQVLASTKGFPNLTPGEKAAYANAIFLETGTWRSWPAAQEAEFWKVVKEQKIPIPLPKPRLLGKDSRGLDLGKYTPREFELWERRERDLAALRGKSRAFKERRESLREKGESIDIGEVEDERNRRKLIGQLRGSRMGKYESDPVWDDVVPIPQDDGKGALAAIAYTDEYAEGLCSLHPIKSFSSCRVQTDERSI